MFTLQTLLLNSDVLFRADFMDLIWESIIYLSVM